MTLAESLTKKVSQLPLEEQLEVLSFVESLEKKRKPKGPRHDPEGVLAEQPDLSLKDFTTARREVWRNFPRDISDE